MNMDGSRYYNVHSAFIEWEGGGPNIKFKSSTDGLHGILFYTEPGMETATDNDFNLLEEMGMRPRGLQPAEAQSTTSEEEGEVEGPPKDPSTDLHGRCVDRQPTSPKRGRLVGSWQPNPSAR